MTASDTAKALLSLETSPEESAFLETLDSLF
jgi:hypothetical protein